MIVAPKRPKWELLLLLWVTMTAFSTTAACDAATLPTTISSGSYTGSDDTIPSSGTTLNVQAMIDDAAANNLTEAVFELFSVVFEGTLTINLPSTASAWAAKGIPVRILIQGGTSSITWPTTYIQINGALALGSNITVQGGTYHYTSQFVHLPTGITIQDGSFFGIEGGSFRAHYSHLTTVSTLVSCGSGFDITLSNRAIFSISHNTMIVSDVSVSSGDWTLRTLYMNGGSLAINDASTLSISDNDIRATRITVSGTWYWFTLHVLGGPVTVGANSTLSISNSKVSASDVSTKGDWWLFTLFVDNSGVTVSDGSVVATSHNVVSFTNVDVRWNYYFYNLYVGNSPVLIHTNSLLSISNIVTTLNNLKIGRSWWFAQYHVRGSTSTLTIHTNSDLTISNTVATVTTVTVDGGYINLYTLSIAASLSVVSSSALSITNNTMSMHDVNVHSYLNWIILRTSKYPVDVTDNSTIAISDIYGTGSSVTTKQGWSWLSFHGEEAPLTIRIFSTVSISNVLMKAVDVTVGSKYDWSMLSLSKSPTGISSSSTVRILNNSMIASNVNSKDGTHWHLMYDVNSRLAIASDSSLNIAKNTRVKATSTSLTGPVTSSDMWLSGADSWPGVLRTTSSSTGATTACSAAVIDGAQVCSDSTAQSGGVFSCDTTSFESSTNNSLTFNCISPHSFTSPPTSPPTTATPTSPTEVPSGYQVQAGPDSGLSISGVIGISVGATIAVVLLIAATVLACLYLCKEAPRPTADVEMASNTNAPGSPSPPPVALHSGYFNDATSSAVMGVPVDDPCVDPASSGGATTSVHRHEPPYAGGDYCQ